MDALEPNTSYHEWINEWISTSIVTLLSQNSTLDNPSVYLLFVW